MVFLSFRQSNKHTKKQKNAQRKWLRRRSRRLGKNWKRLNKSNWIRVCLVNFRLDRYSSRVHHVELLCHAQFLHLFIINTKMLRYGTFIHTHTHTEQTKCFFAVCMHKNNLCTVLLYFICKNNKRPCLKNTKSTTAPKKKFLKIHWKCSDSIKSSKKLFRSV